MAKQARRQTHPTLRATLWFLAVMAPSWWVLLFSGCEFEPSKIHLSPLHPRVTKWMSDSDGGE